MNIETVHNDDGDPIWIFESAEAEARCARMLGLAKFNQHMSRIGIAIGVAAAMLILAFAFNYCMTQVENKLLAEQAAHARLKAKPCPICGYTGGR